MAAIDDLIRMDCASPGRILVIGDVMTDVYVHGHIETCQEGCVKFIEESRVVVPGGAANAERSLECWPTRTKLAHYGREGPKKTRFMVGEECQFRHDDESCSIDLDLQRQEAMRELMLWKPHAVLLSDYDKGTLTPSFLREVIGTCEVLKIPCVADAKREPELYRGAIIKGNSAYFQKYARKARTMTSQAVSTNGPYVPVVWDRGEISTPIITHDVPCVNHVGAGDCFAAHLALALAHGLSLADAAAIAHSAGRVYVQKPHNAPPAPALIREDMLKGS